MSEDFLHTTLGKIGTPVFRLGLAATYRPGKRALYQALDAGVNYLFYRLRHADDVGAARCLMAPANGKQMAANLAAVQQGPPDDDETRFMREFGDVVYRNYRWFM